MLKINIGGELFTTSKDMIVSRSNYFSNQVGWKNTNYVFIDRDPKFFNLILNHLRGYTITLPNNEKDLYMIYEDVQFYGISSLTYEFEEILKIRLPPQERQQIKLYIKNHKSKTIDNIDQLTDRELVTIKSSIEQKKTAEVVFTKVLSIITYIEHNYPAQEGIYNRFISNTQIAQSLIAEMIQQNSKATIKLILLIADTLQNNN